MTLAEALAALDAKASLTADDALTLRQIVYGDGVDVNQAEAETLFRLNADAGEISPEWRALFIEATTDYVVREQEPMGYVDDAKAQWLIGLVSARSKLRGDEIEALLHVLEVADESPAVLAAFVLGVVRSMALWRLRTAGALTPLDIERLRRVIFAKGGERNVAVTREEAEALFDINAAQKPGASDPAWSDFFARAVGNAVLFVPVWQADAATELSHEAWLADTSFHPLQRLKAAFTGGEFQHGAAEGFSDVFHMDFEGADLKRLGEREAADEATEDVAAAVTADEAHWLIDRMGRTPGFDAGERALVAFLKANASSIDPALADYVAKLDDGTVEQRAAS
jgi:hypothetical protein